MCIINEIYWFGNDERFIKSRNVDLFFQIFQIFLRYRRGKEKEFVMNRIIVIVLLALKWNMWNKAGYTCSTTQKLITRTTT